MVGQIAATSRTRRVRSVPVSASFVRNMHFAAITVPVLTVTRPAMESTTVSIRATNFFQNVTAPPGSRPVEATNLGATMVSVFRARRNAMAPPIATIVLTKRTFCAVELSMNRYSFPKLLTRINSCTWSISFNNNFSINLQVKKVESIEITAYRSIIANSFF